ncbi:MAG: hypothetical protein LBH29_06320 [Elusimicrobiota bacterium]|nr:hypothetical protein [Elusimicrobiota bacterium]
MLKVKICGITNQKDATDCVNLGADFLGFHFSKNSAKKISVKLAADIISKFPPFASAVGVFADEEKENAVKIIKKCGLKFIQFSGAETADFCKEIKEGVEGVKIFKTFSVKKEADGSYPAIEEIKSFIGIADYFVLDLSYLEIDGQNETGALKNDFEIIPAIQGLGISYFIVCRTDIGGISEIAEKTAPFGLEADAILDRLPTRKEYEKVKSFIKTARAQ